MCVKGCRQIQQKGIKGSSWEKGKFKQWLHASRHSILKHLFQTVELQVIQSSTDSDWNLRWPVKREHRVNTVGALRGLNVGVFVQFRSVYLGDPPVPVWGQGIGCATEAIIQQAARWRRYTNLGEKQHFVVAVAFGQLWHPMAFPVARSRQVKGLTAGLGRQLVTEKRKQQVWYLSFTCNNT